MQIGVTRDYHVLASSRDGKAADISSMVPERWRGTAYAPAALVSEFHGNIGPLAEAAERAELFSVSPSDMLAPVPLPHHVLAAPGNYEDHNTEMRESGQRSWIPRGNSTARELGLFLKAPGSICGPSSSIELPDNGRLYHHEGELAVVIGRSGKAIDRSRALDHVFGFAPLLDITLRMNDDRQEDRSMRKSFHSFTPMGPWITTSDDIGDPQDLTLKLSVNGDLRQDAWTGDMTVRIDELIELASNVFELRPGDVLTTGTPAGVGPIVDGDTIFLEISKVGALKMQVTTRSW